MILGALLAIAVGHALVAWATASNAYFSQIVRIQSERDHAVATGGPYRWVRHPAYVGTILTGIGTPVALSSWPALGLAIVGAVLIVARTRLEDRTLRAELAGYEDYCERVRQRLFPGVW